MAQLQITCLGTFQIMLDGESITSFPTDKARGLLVYLALEGRVHERSALAQLLWPGYSEESANNSLRQSLHRLRQLLHDAKADSPWLLITRHTVQFNPVLPCQVDVALFSELLDTCYTHSHSQLALCQPCLARLRQALDLYVGDFLADITIADSDPFEEWRRVMQEQYHVAALDALEQLTDACEMNGNYEEAQRLAERQISLEPWREQAHRQLMRALARNGRRSAALAQYHTCRQLLLEELGSEPEALTTSLYDKIRNGELDERKPGRKQVYAKLPPSEEVIPFAGQERSEAESPPIRAQVSASPLFEPGETGTATPTQLLPLAIEQQQPDKLTPSPSPTEQGDKQIESPNHLVTSSPPQPVTSSLGPIPPHYNLPMPLPPLIGRERELAEISTALQHSAGRMLTLAGPGGMGKTRLALAAAAKLAPYFTAGVCLVELAELTEPTLLPQTVAAALGQTELAEAGREDPVARYVSDKALLLVLDNCEHVNEAVAYWSRRWLSACPRLCILATSHGALAIPGEAVWPIPTLAYPPAAELESDQLVAYGAVQLFLARAREVKADFTLTAANGAAIAEICRRLEGIPLALELAAARIRSLTPTEIALRLNKGINAALANKRSAPARHQTMQAALDWSFASLDADEQLLFQQLAVFVSGFTLPAVEIVTQLPDALDLLERLIDRALVITETLGEQTRYRLLDVIRKYAHDKVSASGMAVALRQRHAAYFLQLAESAQMDAQADGEALWLQPEAENLSSAVEWALTHNEAAIAVRLAGALTWYWWMRGYLRAQRVSLQRALESTNQQQEATRNDDRAEPAMYALAAGALFALWEELARAHLAFTQALALAEAEQNQHLIGLALRRLATVAIQQKAYRAANEFIERGLAVWQALGGIWHIAWLYAHQGDLADQRGDQRQAWLAYEASTKLPVNPGARAYPFRRMAYLALARGDHSHAMALCRESLQLNLASGDRQGIAACLVGIARFTVAGAQTLPQAVSLRLLRRATELLGAVETLLQTVEGRLLQVDEVAYQQTTHWLQEQRAVVAPETYQAALAIGRALTIQQATALALQEEAIAPTVEPIGQKGTAGSQADQRSHADAASVRLDPLHDWAEMPAVDLFVERRAEVAQLTAWLTPAATGASPARFVSILGMGGMGKTTLATVVTKAVAPSFAVVIWRSLLNAPPVSELLRNWLQTLSRQTLTTPPDSLDEQLRLLLTYLQQERCLLVLDNVESIFAADSSSESVQSRAGVVRPGYEGYDQLFQRLANSEHQSCLLLTSREQPYALLRSGRQAQTTGRVQVLPLPGLDPQAGYALLQNNGLHTSAAEAAQLVENYSGNPLALQIVASTIADFFGGDVAAFQQEEGALFDGMRLVLDQQFARLSSLERDILIWLAIEREPVTVPLLRGNFVQPVATAPLLEALQALQNRSLLEKRDTGLTLQNVIIEYTIEYLVEQIYQELVGGGGWIVEGNANPPPSTLPMSFFNRFALIKAQAKEYVRQSQWRLLVQPLAERLTTTLGRAEVTARLPYLLDRLRAAKVRTGYAAGNLINLLVHLESNLTALDCSHLAVWQADLRGVMFAAIDFTGADLTNTAFTANIETGKIKFLPSGELLIAGISKGELCLWRTIDGQLTAAFSRATNSRLPLIFSEDGNWIVVVDLDYKVQLWSTEQGNRVQILTGHRSAIHTLAMSKDGTQLASGSVDGVVNLWEWRHGQRRQQLNGYQLGIGALAFSPDGNTLATGSGDGIIRLWDTRSTATDGRLLTTLQAHNHSVGALAFSPDGRWLASGGHGSNIRLWDLQNEGMPGRHLQGHTHMIRNLCFQPSASTSASVGSTGSSVGSTGSSVGSTGSPTDAYLLASSSADHTVRLWSLTGELRYTLLGHTDDITALDFSADGRQLACSGTDQIIYWWDVRTGQMVNSLHAYRYIPTTVVRFSPDGELVVSGSADQLVRLWPVMIDESTTLTSESTRCAVLRGHTNFVRAVAVSPSGHMIASGSADHTIRLWERTTHTELQKLTGHTGAILSLAFTRTDHSGTLLASASGDGSIRLWSINEAKPTVASRPRVLLGHQEEVLALTFDPTGRTLVSGGMNGNVWIWDVESGTTRLRLTGHTAAVTMVAISADGRTLATSAFDQTVRLWDLQTGDCLYVKKDEHVGTRTVVFVPQPGTDDELLAYDGDDFAIYLWPWRTGGPAYPLRGHSSVVLGLDISPTAPHLVSISRDGTIRIWDLATRTCRQVFHAPGPYAGMKISDVTGISDAQKVALRALGAVEK